MDEGRSEQQSTSDDADAPSLVPLLSASVLRGGDEPPGSSLLSFEGAGRVREVEAVRHCSGRVEEGRSGQQSTSDDADALSLVPCSPPQSSVCATSFRARRC